MVRLFSLKYFATNTCGIRRSRVSAANRLRPRLEPLEDRQLLSTCHVTRLSDSGAGKGFRGDLRYCINKVNAEPGPDAIDFTVTGTINLNGALPHLSSDIDVLGPGSELLTVRRDSGGDYRILEVDPGASVLLFGLTIANGFLSDVSEERGGGILNKGTLTLLGDVAVVGNRAYSGGGIFTQGPFAAYFSNISNNTGGSGISPGGATTSIFHSTISGNDGGGISATAALNFITVEDSIVTNNTTVFGRPGISIYEGTLTVERTTISNNHSSSGSGGGIYIDAGVTATIRDTTIALNSTTHGGGIHNGHSTDVLIENSTISSNTATSQSGGGIRSEGKLTLRHSTIHGNSSANMGGGIWAAGGQSFNFFRNNIIAGNSAPNAPDMKGPLNTSGFNLFGNHIGATGFAESDLLDVDPLLGPLADNGGPTLTHALLPGSPAIDAGDNTDAPEFDQRGPGFPRIVNGTIDIGAFEVQSTGVPSLPDYLAVLITGDFEKDDGSGG